MRKDKKQRLEAAGWKVGTVREFLDLSPEESLYVEFKLALSEKLRELRTQKGLTQVAVAAELRSSQSRVAKLEAADPSVSLDLLVRSLLKLGATRRDLARAIDSGRAHRAPVTSGMAR